MSIDLTNITEDVASEWWGKNQDEPWDDLPPSTKQAVKSVLLPIIHRVAESTEAIVRAEIRAKLTIALDNGEEISHREILEAVE